MILRRSEKSGHVGSDGSVWEVLYRVICEFFFLDSSRELPVFSTSLCLSVSILFLLKVAYMREVLDLSNCSQAYNTLTETATRQITVRNVLRQQAVLGG